MKRPVNPKTARLRSDLHAAVKRHVGFRLTTEDDLSETVVEGLRLIGCTVLQTTVRHYRRGYGTGQDKGIPDLLVRKKSWHPALWLGLELKGEDTKVSPEQQALYNEEAIVIARSWEEAHEAVKAVDERMRRNSTVLPPVVRPTFAVEEEADGKP